MNSEALTKMKLFRPKFESDPRWKRDNWRALNGDKARIYHSVLALRELVDELKGEVLARIGKLDCMPGTTPNMANLKAEVRFKVVEIGKALAAAKTLLEVGEASEEFKTAEKEYVPLLRQAEEAEAREEAARIDRQMKEGALQQARADAEKRALENAASDPAVLQAARSLAQAEAAASEL
jgi:hypothetical protein